MIVLGSTIKGTEGLAKSQKYYKSSGGFSRTSTGRLSPSLRLAAAPMWESLHESLLNSAVCRNLPVDGRHDPWVSLPSPCGKLEANSVGRTARGQSQHYLMPTSA